MVGAGVLGWAGRWLAPEKFLLNPGAGHGASSAYARADAGAVVDLAENKWPSHGQGWRSLRVVATGLGLWWAPVVAVGLLLGWQSVWTQLGLFFSKAALITFGGAYAVLPYVAEQAVVEHAWLTTPQMMSGLALAETTPGPLIMVLQFVGFIAAWQSPGGMPPLLSATLGAGLTTWVTFLPSFIFVLAGAPYIERLQQVRALTAVLTTVTAAVVGVILNLAVWFGWHTVCPDGRGVDVFAALLALGLFLGLHFRQWGVIPVVMTGGLLGMAWQLLGPG
jgi:chromate transporter